MINMVYLTFARFDLCYSRNDARHLQIETIKYDNVTDAERFAHSMIANGFVLSFTIESDDGLITDYDKYAAA